VVQVGDRLGFALESLAQKRIAGEVGRKDLHRNGALEPRVARSLDLSHAAGTERRFYLVRAKSGSGGERHLYRANHVPESGMAYNRGMRVEQDVQDKRSDGDPAYGTPSRACQAAPLSRYPSPGSTAPRTS
jgi:hypothetical protein